MLKLIDNYLDKEISKIIDKEIKFEVFLAGLYTECKYPQIYKIIIERLYQRLYSRKILLYPQTLLKLDISSELRLEPDYIFHGQEKDTALFYNITNGLCLKKGIIFKILEKLNLQKSKKALIHDLMILDEEIKDNQYIQECVNEKLTDFKYVFEKEINMKFKDTTLIHL